MSGLGRLRKIVGILLAAWGGVRSVVDLLGSFAATKKYVSAAYFQIASAPSSRSLTVTVVVVGSVLLLYEPLRGLWKPDITSTANSRDSEPTCPVEMIPSDGPGTEMLLSIRNIGELQRFRGQARLLARRNDPNRLRRVTYDLEWERTGTRDAVLATGESCNLRIASAYDDRGCDLEYLELWGLNGTVRERKEWSRWSLGGIVRPEYDLEITVFGASGHRSNVFTLRAGREVALEMFERQPNYAVVSSPTAPTEGAQSANRLLSYVGIDGEGWFVLPCGTSYLQLVNIYNCESANPVTANNVRATVRFTHANQRDVLTIRDAGWRGCNPRTGANEFPSSAFIGPNTRGKLVFLCQLQSDLKKWFVPDLGSNNIRELNPGHWDVVVTLTSDNCATLIGRGGFTILAGEEGRLVYDIPALRFEYEPATRLEISSDRLDSNDPRLRIEIFAEQTKKAPYWETRFILDNEGGGTAYRVKIGDIDVSTTSEGRAIRAIAAFPTVDSIAATKRATIRPSIDTELTLFMNELIPFLKCEINASSTAEIVKPFNIVYSDYAGNQIETLGEMVYTPPNALGPAELAEGFMRVAKQFHRKNALEVVVEREDLLIPSPINVRNQRFRKISPRTKSA